MKKIILTLLMTAIVPFMLMADPPKKVTVTYNKENSTVKVVVFHPVAANSTTHYVKKITIKVDGKEVKTFNETKQDNSKTDTREVVLKGIKPGSFIEAEADCSIMGSKKGKIKVE